MRSSTLELTKQLVTQPSVTPDDAGCQEIIIARLEKIGFKAERMRFGDVDNVWLRHGSESPLFVFAGHTDVVPPGPLNQWKSFPFSPEIRSGLLYGRGVTDMKGSLAAMVTACEAFITAHPKHAGSIGLLITSDEEGPAVNGTVRVVETLERREEKIDWCLVGEPSSHRRLGDVIKNGRRGSLSGQLKIHGQQGHVAYPHLAENPIQRFAPALLKLTTMTWDQGNEHFPPTTFQISNIASGTGATNVIPGELEVLFNFRFSTESMPETLQKHVHAALDQYALRYDLNWELSGKSFLTPEGQLTDTCKQAIHEVASIETELSTAGGTSDGRFIAPTGTQVIELGPVNESIHKINEHVRVADLDTLSNIYYRVLEIILSSNKGG